jgi:hypothetical protein
MSDGSQDYRASAARCIDIAEQTTDPSAKAALLEMARLWQNLANQAVRNCKADLIYETPIQLQQQIQPNQKDDHREG